MATIKTTKKPTPQAAAAEKKIDVAAKTATKATAAKKAGNDKPSPAKSPSKQAENAPDAKTAPESPKPTAAPAIAASSGGKWDEIRQLLLQMKEQTLVEIKRSIKKGSETIIGEEPTGDIYDQASSERDRELGLLLNDRERDKLHNIDEALLRIAEGEYGICEECDEDIPLGRLKVLPFTRHCVKCKSDLEKIQAQTRRMEEDRAYREIPVGDDDEG